MKNILLIIVAISLKIQGQGQTAVDIDGNTYQTIDIGSQIWIKENLRVTKLNDGTIIPVETDNSKWVSLTSPGSCTYNNTNNSDTIITYGRLYNWYTVETGKLCPIGWHVPTNEEWAELLNSIGGKDYAGNKLKEAGTSHWIAPNSGADNSTDFTGLPGGDRHAWGGYFQNIGEYGDWWSSSEFSNLGTVGVFWMSSVNSFAAVETSGLKSYGLSVRCLKDDHIIIKDNLSNVHYSIYPNPAKDIIYFLNIGPSTYIEVFNLQGVLVLSKINNSNSVEIKNLKSGIYYIKFVEKDKTIYVSKIIKE